MQRLYFVQWLRVFLIALVVAHHAGQAYGPTGGSWPIYDPAQAFWLGPFFALNASFFMGFFFLIAGYFTGGSFDRKGGAAFVRDRLIRLGIPLAFFTFVVFPPLVYYWQAPAEGFAAFYLADYIGGWHIRMGHLWFVAQLLVLSLLYALWRVALAGRGDDHVLPVPGDRAVLVYAVALGVTGALVRTVYPQDDWVDILWLVPAEPAHLPQYVSLFVVEIAAGYGRWFNAIPPRRGGRWFVVGMIAFVGILAAYALQDRLPAILGLQVVWGFLEAFVCIGMILGLLAFFRRYCSEPDRWLDRLDGNVYGVYLIHWLVVIALQAAILAMPWSGYVKFFAVTVAGIVASFALTAAARQVPAIRRVV